MRARTPLIILATVGWTSAHAVWTVVTNVNFCWWIIDGQGYETPPTNWENVSNYYEWEAFMRPMKELSAEVVDKFDQRGYVGRILVKQDFNGSALNGCEFRKYYLNTGGGGSGGAGTPGGG